MKMEKRFEVKISIWADAHSEECHRHIEGRSIVESFLHDVAADGRRFRLVSAGRLHAVVHGTCTSAEAELLREELDDFFAVYGLDCGANGWRLDTGEEMPSERMVFEDGEAPEAQLSLTLTLDEDWAAAQVYEPAQSFYGLLQHDLGCWFSHRVDLDPPTPAHLRLVITTDHPVGRIWETGRAALRKIDALAHVMEFEVCDTDKREE